MNSIVLKTKNKLAVFSLFREKVDLKLISSDFKKYHRYDKKYQNYENYYITNKFEIYIPRKNDGTPDMRFRVNKVNFAIEFMNNLKNKKEEQNNMWIKMKKDGTPEIYYKCNSMIVDRLKNLIKGFFSLAF